MHLTPPITSMNDAFSVKNKNVVVTGGNRGSGSGSAPPLPRVGQMWLFYAATGKRVIRSQPVLNSMEADLPA
jgi:hypothetical protein